MSAPSSANGIRLVHVLTVPQSLVFLRGQIGFMKARGFEVTIVCSPGPDLDEFGRREHVRTFGVVMPRRITPFADATSVARLVRIFREVRPHVVHSHTPKGGLLGMIAATLAGVPARIYHMRGLPLETAAGARRVLLSATERVSCALSSEVLCVSHSLRQTAIDEGVVNPDRIRVLLSGSGNGVDARRRFNPEHVGADVRSETRSALGIAEGAKVVGFVGRLARDKGVIELLHAWQRVSAAHPEARLVLVGEHEPRDPVPDAVKRALAQDPTVRLVGFQRDIERYYAAFDVLVLPTHREGFPNVLLEAGAMRLPVVATRVSGCVDAVRDGVTGFLVPKGDEVALAEAVVRYLDDAALRRDHGEAARRRAAEAFDPLKIWEALAGTYERLAANSGVEPPRYGAER